MVGGLVRYRNKWITISSWKKPDWESEHLFGFHLAYYTHGMGSGHKYWIMVNLAWWTVYIGFIQEESDD